jgi:hypothetical protein
MLALIFFGSGIIYKPAQFVGLSRSVVSAQQLIKTTVCSRSELYVEWTLHLTVQRKEQVANVNTQI